MDPGSSLKWDVFVGAGHSPSPGAGPCPAASGRRSPRRSSYGRADAVLVDALMTVDRRRRSATGSRRTSAI